MHAMLTVLKSDNIRTELWPLLWNHKTTDDELLENLTKAFLADEREHQDKFNKPVRQKVYQQTVLSQLRKKRKGRT